MSFKDKNSAYTLLIEPALKEYISNSGAPAGLKDAMSYSLMAGGKRLRPCMMLAACEMLGGRVDDALPFACALEMIHTYSLIHDDLPCMDDDDYRRGKPSNHVVYGEANAVLAGDGLLSLAMDVMLGAICRSPGCNGTAAAMAVSKGAGVGGMVAGQYVDLYWEDKAGAGPEELAYIHTHKTADMIVAALVSGAHMAGATKDSLAALAGYGREYGLLFQITDDILDVEGSFEGMGKSTGKDQRESKLTYPSLYGLDKARELAAQSVNRAIASLNIFGEEADYFRELARYTLNRKN